MALYYPVRLVQNDRCRCDVAVAVQQVGEDQQGVGQLLGIGCLAQDLDCLAQLRQGHVRPCDPRVGNSRANADAVARNVAGASAGTRSASSSQRTAWTKSAAMKPVQTPDGS